MTELAYLEKVDPSRRMMRFYAIWIAPTLFGEWAMVREWGRVGSPGRLRESWFTHRAARTENPSPTRAANQRFKIRPYTDWRNHGIQPQAGGLSSISSIQQSLPVLDELFQTSVRWLYITGLPASQNCWSFFAFTKSALVINH